MCWGVGGLAAGPEDRVCKPESGQRDPYHLTLLFRRQSLGCSPLEPISHPDSGPNADLNADLRNQNCILTRSLGTCVHVTI